MQFEPEPEAQKNAAFVELHSGSVAASIEETKNDIVEPKVRIARAEDILGTQIQHMQKKTALGQAIGRITKQHTTHLKGVDFNTLYTVVMHVTENVGIGCGRMVKSNANVTRCTYSVHADIQEAHDVH